jgi:hypothetical protein
MHRDAAVSRNTARLVKNARMHGFRNHPEMIRTSGNSAQLSEQGKSRRMSRDRWALFNSSMEILS